MSTFEPNTSTELYVLMSDQCNFSCAHCLNSSGPQATRWMSTNDSITGLADEINRSLEIRILHFSGGEPTLFLAQIRQLLSIVTRPIRVAFTTNAWFVDRSIHFLDDLPLTAVVISYDRYHAPFISLKKILPLIEHFRSRNIDVSFNSVFSDISELAELVPVQALGIPVHTSRVIKSGRAQWEAGWYDANSIKETCPSLSPAQRRVPELAKTIYMPQSGFTPCCGPLVFDELAPSAYTFTAKLSDYPSNPLLKDLSRGTFEEQAKKIGLNLSPLLFQSSCDACTILYSSIAPGLPSIAEVSQTKTETTYLPFVDTLTPNKDKLLSQLFIVGYTETLDPKELKTRIFPNAGQAGGVTMSTVNPSDYLPVETFVRGNYYALYPDYYSKANVDEFAGFCSTYLSWPSTRGFVYRKNGKIVATLFANIYDPHPALKIPTLHIGYWGYDRDQVTKEEALWIKSHWLQALLEWSDGTRMIDASFDSFNKSAIRFAKSLGFERRMLRLNKKGAET